MQTFDHLSSVLQSLVAPFERVGTKSARFFSNGKLRFELIANFSAALVII